MWTSAFILFGSAIWALLPLVVRDEMRLGASAYGQLLSALGAGALIGAAMLPKFNRMASVDGLITGASGVLATVTIGSGLVRNRILMVALMRLGDAAWMIVLSSLKRGSPHGGTGLGPSPFLGDLSARVSGWFCNGPGMGRSGRQVGHQVHIGGRRRGAHCRRRLPRSFPLT
jgi:hypothetical protein